MICDFDEYQVALPVNFRGISESIFESPLFLMLEEHHTKGGRVDTAEVSKSHLFVFYLIAKLGRLGVTNKREIIKSFRATYEFDVEATIALMAGHGFLEYDKATGWIWIKNAARWQNPSIRTGNKPVELRGENVSGAPAKGATSAISTLWAEIDALMKQNFPFKAQFLKMHGSYVALDVAATSPKYPNIRAALISTGVGTDPSGGCARRDSTAIQPRLNHVPFEAQRNEQNQRVDSTTIESRFKLDTETKTRTRTDRSFGEEPHARVRESDPTERTPAEDGCPFDDAPHSLDSACHAPPEPDPAPEPVRTTREPHPLAGMGSTRPPPPLVTLTEWQALPLDAKVKHVAHPSGCDAALRDHVQAFDDAAQVLYEHHARAVEDAGLMPRGDGLDAARRAVVYLSAEVPSPVLPSEAAERLMGLVDIAASKPEIVGRPLSGGVPAWVSPDVLFGASASATKFQPTAQRLPDNLNRAKAHAKITDRVRGAQLRVMEAYKPKDLPPGWSEEDAKAVADYVIAKGIAKLRKKEFEVDPSMEAKAVEMEASHAA